MKKYVIKTIIVLLIALMVFSFISKVHAVSTADVIRDRFTGTVNPDGSDSIRKILSVILDVTRTIGAAVAIVILMVIGAKYIIASAGERADLKKYAVNYVIGALILFGASGILTMIKEFVIDAVS